MVCFKSHKNGSGRAQSLALDRMILLDKKRLSKEVRLLLLGAGESGKSTILKQMKLLYAQGFSETERLDWKPVVYGNIIESLRMIHNAMAELHYEFDDAANKSCMEYVLARQGKVSNNIFPQLLLGPIKALWQDCGVKSAVAKGNEYALHDNLAYFMNDLNRIGRDSYVPNDQDLLRLRLRTTGITEALFNLGQLNYRIIDVGGQRSERKKWIHYFESVDCLFFLVAISGYDQCLAEDRNGNQMHEALMLWDSIVNSRWFTSSAIILFLNKMDIFEEKLPRSPIHNYGFTDYSGRPDNCQAASKYFFDKFKALSRTTNEIYGHFINATDTNLLRITMSAVEDMIVRRNFNELLI